MSKAKETTTLAEALLRRKELQSRLDRMGPINRREMFETQVKRVKVTDAVDEVTVVASKVKFADFDAEYNHYARSLRRIDAVIQRANWETKVEVHAEDVQDYKAPE